MNKDEYNGYGLSLSIDGAVYYCFDDKKTNLEELVKLEITVQSEAMNKKYRLFKLYDTDSIELTVVSLN